MQPIGIRAFVSLSLVLSLSGGATLALADEQAPAQGQPAPMPVEVGQTVAQQEGLTAGDATTPDQLPAPNTGEAPAPAAAPEAGTPVDPSVTDAAGAPAASGATAPAIPETRPQVDSAPSDALAASPASEASDQPQPSVATPPGEGTSTTGESMATFPVEDSDANAAGAADEPTTSDEPETAETPATSDEPGSAEGPSQAGATGEALTSAALDANDGAAAAPDAKSETAVPAVPAIPATPATSASDEPGSAASDVSPSGAVDAAGTPPVEKAPASAANATEAPDASPAPVASDAPAPTASPRVTVAVKAKAAGATATATARASQDGWVTTGGSTYYFSKGAKVTGLTLIDGSWYYLDPSRDGARATGLVSVPTDDAVGAYATMCFDAQGRRLTGAQSIGGSTYYFSASNGDMVTGFNFDGSSIKFYDLASGQMQVGERLLHGGWRNFASDGSMSEGFTTLEPERIAYYDAFDGVRYSGEHVIDGYRRYFDPSTGAVDKYGYQNPIGFYQVSANNVYVPNYSGDWRFSYASPSQISVGASRWDCIETFIARAFDYLGTSYVWDFALAPGEGIDCAGLVMQCLYATGMSLGDYYTPYNHYFTPGHDHYANDMCNDPGFLQVGFGDRQRGDLIFYPGHVAIYLGDDTVIDSFPGHGADGVGVRSMWHYPVNYVVRRPFI